MPDATLARGLIASAKALCPDGVRRRPRQADLRQAVSAACYAAFHELARSCADTLVGSSRSRRSNRAWVEVYRGLDHGAARNACDGVMHVSIRRI